MATHNLTFEVLDNMQFEISHLIRQTVFQSRTHFEGWLWMQPHALCQWLLLLCPLKLNESKAHFNKTILHALSLIQVWLLTGTLKCSWEKKKIAEWLCATLRRQHFSQAVSELMKLHLKSISVHAVDGCHWSSGWKGKVRKNRCWCRIYVTCSEDHSKVIVQFINWKWKVHWTDCKAPWGNTVWDLRLYQWNVLDLM